MNPLRVKARNYRTFAALDVALPTGCVAILGTNGAGKSSLANLVDLALFGPDGRSWAPYLTQGSESTELEIELHFEHGGRLFKVRRGYSARAGGKTTLDLETLDETTLTSVPLTKEDQRQTQAFLEQILGMTRETFRASSMLVQGDGAAFTEAKPADRKRVLAKILGLERYDELLVYTKSDRRRHEDGLQRLAGELEAAERELVNDVGGDRIASGEEILSATGAALAELGGQEEAAAAELEALAQAVTAGEALARQKAEALAYATDVSGRLLPLETRLREADEAQAAIAVAEDEAASLTTPGQMAALSDREKHVAGLLEAHRRAILERDEKIRTRELREREKAAIEAQAAAARGRLVELEARITSFLRAEIDTCPTCRQTLGEDARLETISSLRAQAQTLYDDAKAIEERATAIVLEEIPPAAEIPTTETLETFLGSRGLTSVQRVDVVLEDIRSAIAKARDAELQRERLAGRLQVLREKVSARPTDEDLQAARAALAQAREELEKIQAPADEELDVVRANALAARRRVDELGEKRLELELTRTKIETGLERLRELRDRTATAREERAKIQAEIDELVILERAYGRDGIPALIIGRAAIPSIEVEACRILGELGTSYRVELRTEKALASGGTADALDVVIVTEDGERPYETFSGGERTRINLALRIGLARLLAHRRGAESRILVIDEPEFLDQAGTAALATVLRGLGGDFERIYLISHVPELRDSLDAALTVTRGVDGYSTIGGIA